MGEYDSLANLVLVTPPRQRSFTGSDLLRCLPTARPHRSLDEFSIRRNVPADRVPRLKHHRSRLAEIAAVRLRRRAALPGEVLSQCCGRPEPGLLGDLLHVEICLLEQSLGEANSLCDQ